MTEMLLSGINTSENIRLIQDCIYHDYYKVFSKGAGIMAINHQPLQVLVLLQYDDP